MSLFKSQLRGLLGIKEISIPNPEVVLSEYYISYESSHISGLTSFEWDRWTRVQTIQNLVDTIETLSSLSRMIQSLPGMVVLDEIQRKVEKSLDSVKESHQALDSGSFDKASSKAREAVQYAESAFFDPTMVSMLYFPSEHKFAVYMPIFVPISVPLVFNLISEIRRRIGRKRKLIKEKEE